MLETVEGVVSLSFWRKYKLNTVTTFAMLTASNVLALIGLVFVFVRDLRRKKAMPVAVVGGDPIDLPSLGKGQKYHVFISYTWSSGALVQV